MNWRALFSVALALIIRGAVIAKLGWTYRPFRDPFSLYEFGRDATVFVFILGACLTIVNIIFPRTED